MLIILLIEEDGPARSTMTTALERDGHFVMGVRNAGEAIRHLTQWTPEVIILDLAAPENAGLEIVKVLQEALRNRPQVRVLATSDVAATGLKLSCRRFDANNLSPCLDPSFTLPNRTNSFNC